MKARGLLLFGLLKTTKALSCHVGTKPEEKSDFSEYTITKTLTREDFPRHPSDFSENKGPNQTLNVKLQETLNPKQLPFSNHLSANYLMRCGATRSSQYELLARGDNRTIEQIRSDNGFYPEIILNQVSIDEIADIQSISCHLNLSQHRNVGPRNTEFVSFTDNMLVAHYFGLLHSTRAPSKDESQENNYTVYIVKAVGAVGPSALDNFSFESEHSIPGGVDYKDIISFRQCKVANRDVPSQISVTCGSIFMSKEFERRYPHAAETALKAQCLKTEDCDTALKQTRYRRQ